ncbi:MAG: hypothetical protein PVJ86_12640 [Phycisphaerales bacterium]|jgi:hypothetical protein
MNQTTLHKAIGIPVLVVWLLVSVVGPSQVLGAEGITGDWEITMDFNGWQAFAKLSISKAPDGTLAGKWGTSELSDVKFEDQKLTFVRTVTMQDREFTMTYAGTLKDGKLTGTISSDRGEFPANGARTKPKSPVVGDWDIKLTIRERDINCKLSISQKPDGTLEGEWTSEFGEHVVSDVKFKDGKLTFSRKSKFGDRELESTYEGTVEGHKLTGQIKSEMGELAANGQHVGAALIGKWELTTTSERGTRTRTLTVHGDMTGRYQIFGDTEAAVKIKDLKLDDNQATFNIEMGSADQPFLIGFKGTLDGAALNGQFTSSRGDSTVVGKKMGTASALVGTWQITRESSRGTRTNTLKINADMTGTYTSRDNEIDITDLSIEGDQVTFKVTMRYGEREVPVEFKGKLDGTSLNGERTTSRGTSKFTGRKVD